MNYLQIKLIDMRRFLVIISMLLMVVAAKAQEFNRVPSAWKWINEKEVLFTYNGTYTDSTAFVVNAKTGKQRTGV